MEKMLVTQGLNELKTLDARINRAIREGNFVAAAKTCEKKVTPSKTKEEYIRDAKSSMQSVKDLIQRRAAIKSAIVESNARTEVEICGEKMSVAKAIDIKSAIQYRKSLLEALIDQRNMAVSTMNRKNADMENKIDSLVATAFGKESKTTVKPEDYDSIAVPYRTSNEYSLVDPLNVDKIINEEREYIEEFFATVDQVLQVSNCVTFIEV